MTSEKVITGALNAVAQQNGYKEGHYHIVLDNEYEFINWGVQKKYRIVHSDGTTMLHLIVKLPPTSGGTGYTVIPTEYRFFNNVHYFSKVQPLLKQYGVVPMAPRLYASSLKKNEEYLILEDLEAKGFIRVNLSQGLGKAQLALIISTLSTFHLTVRYWKTRNLSEFNNVCTQFKSFLAPQNKDKIKEKYEVLLKKILNACWILSREVYGTQLRKNIEDALTEITKKILRSVCDVQDQPWATLVNCYIWIPNILFRYHTISGQPIDVAFEDWSSARIGSPIIDLSFLVLASSSTALYAELQNMLEHYFTTHLSKEDLQRHYPIYGIFGVYASLVVNVAAAFENDIPACEFQTKTITDELSTSETIPDIRTRVLCIVKTAVDIGII